MLSLFLDSYLTVVVNQKGRIAVHKQTQVKKSCSQPAFNETFAFSIATSNEKLKSTTIAIKVMSKELLRSDIVIGEVMLTGKNSSSKHTFWSNLLNMPKNKISQWSEILQPQKL